MTEVENISTHSKRPREPNYGSFPDASGINQVGAADPLDVRTRTHNVYVYVCGFAVFQDAFDFSGQSGASEPLLNDSSLPVRYHVFLQNSTFIVVPISP